MNFGGIKFSNAKFQKGYRISIAREKETASRRNRRPDLRAIDIYWSSRWREFTKENLSRLEVEVASLENLWKDLKGKYHE